MKDIEAVSHFENLHVVREGRGLNHNGRVGDDFSLGLERSQQRRNQWEVKQQGSQTKDQPAEGHAHVVSIRRLNRSSNAINNKAARNNSTEAATACPIFPPRKKAL